MNGFPSVKNRPLRLAALLISLAAVLAACGWFPGAEGRTRGKLERLLDDDLAVIAGEIAARDTTALLLRPFWRIVAYKATPNSGSYSHLCEVDFYYLKAIKMKQVRKYRYNPDTGEWERYKKDLVHLLPGAPQ